MQTTVHDMLFHVHLFSVVMYGASKYSPTRCQSTAHSKLHLDTLVAWKFTLGHASDLEASLSLHELQAALRSILKVVIVPLHRRRG